jgi:iron complex transport system ATP-binding protein
MALAQQANVQLLDEPADFLDVSNQAVRYYTDCRVAMSEVRIHAKVDPNLILTAKLVRDVFVLESRVVNDPTTNKPLMLPLGRHHVLESM